MVDVGDPKPCQCKQSVTRVAPYQREVWTCDTLSANGQVVSRGTEYYSLAECRLGAQFAAEEVGLDGALYLIEPPPTKATEQVRLTSTVEPIPHRPNRYFPPAQHIISQADRDVLQAEVYPPVAEALLSPIPNTAALDPGFDFIF